VSDAIKQFQTTSQKLDDLRAEKVRLEVSLADANKRLRGFELRVKKPNPPENLDKNLKEARAWVKKLENRMTTVDSSIMILSNAMRDVGQLAKNAFTLSGKRIRH
jgi:chaperonin cofactor prefoldin